MNNTYKIRRTGGTCVITIPESIMREASLKVGEMVRIDLTNSNLITIRRANQDLEAARKRTYCTYNPFTQKGCGAELTSTDLEAGYCSNCKKEF